VFLLLTQNILFCKTYFPFFFNFFPFSLIKSFIFNLLKK